MSASVPQITFRGTVWAAVRRQYVDPKVAAFFREREIRMGDVWEVGAEEAISDTEFAIPSRGGVHFSYFYDVLLRGLTRTKGGDIVGCGYTLTFDEDEVDRTADGAMRVCERSNLPYGVVHLGGEPIFYYLYLDLQDILRQAKRLQRPPSYAGG